MKLFVIFILALFSAEIFAADPVVYSRCARTTDSLTISRSVTINGTLTPVTKTFIGLDIYDQLMDTSTPLYHSDTGDLTAPCDLVYRDAVGVETVIYDCSTTGSVVGGATCMAVDPSVSFDGTKIYYSVVKGNLYQITKNLNNRVLNGAATSGTFSQTLPNKKINVEGAHIRQWTVGGSSVDLTPYVAGKWDTFPAELPNGKILFGTTEGNAKTTLVFDTNSTDENIRFATIHADGTNREIASHDALTQVLHPYITKDGWITYSSWQTGGRIPFESNNGKPGGSTTLQNKFPIHHSRPDGSSNAPILGQHSKTSDLNASGENYTALHFLTQFQNEDICTGNYYRGNSNNALGAISCFRKEGFGLEGRDPYVQATVKEAFLPTVAYTATNWGSNADKSAPVNTGWPTNTSVTHPNYSSPLPLKGKIGFPESMPNGDMLLTWGNGWCGLVLDFQHLTALGKTVSEIQAQFVTGNGQGVGMNNVTWTAELMNARTPSLGGDIAGCDNDLFILPAAKIGNSTTPADLVPFVTSKNWHYFQARVVLPYTNKHGIAAPPVVTTPTFTTTDTPFGRLGASSTWDREVIPFGGITSHDEDLHAFHIQGTQTIEHTDAELCGIRVTASHPNRDTSPFGSFVSSVGERWSILGELYVKNYSGGSPILDINGNPDTSWLLEMPADTPFMMQGIDCQGRNLSVDQNWQSLKPREIRTCEGCHVHSRPGLLAWNQSHAFSQNNPVLLGRGSVPLLIGETAPGTPIMSSKTGYGYTIEYNRDIKPIFQSRCNSCHSAGAQGGAAAGLELDVYPADPRDTTSTYYRLIIDNGQLLVPLSLRFTGNNGVFPVGHARAGEPKPLDSPMASKYVWHLNSRRSLLYWKAAGQRLDNRTDATLPNDLDYGNAHPATGITTEELRTLSRWIDTGALAEYGAVKDYTKPTLHLGATVATGAITHFVVGTVDTGSGISPGTLNVCLVSGGTCGSNLAPAANINGIVSFAVSPNITDVNQVIRATVEDVNGNITTIDRTAGFFINAGDTGAAPTPDPVQISVGGAATISEGDTFSRTITFSDGEDTNADGWTVDIDWCGTPQNGVAVSAGASSFNISRLFSTAGSCAVTVTITDDVGETDSGSFTITINAVTSPGFLSLSVGGDSIIDEGASFTRTISISDAGDAGNNGWTYSVDWGNGLGTTNGSISAGSSSFDITKVFPDGDARHTVIVTVTDDVTDIASGTFDVIVRNVEPTASIICSQTAEVGVTHTIGVTVIDPGADTAFVNIDWGDGTTNNKLSHIYTAAGTYRIKIWVMDEDGMWIVGRKKITVN